VSTAEGSKPRTPRRYTPEQKAQAVRLVRQLRAELGTFHGTVQRVASQLGYGVESVRAWVHQADIDDGLKGGTKSADAARMKELEQEIRELRRTNEILRRSAAFMQNGRLCGPGRSLGRPGWSPGSAYFIRSA
jgi:transposase